MKNYIYLIFSFFSISCLAQNLTCDDFNEGTFNGTMEQLPGIEWKVVRTQNKQIETLTKIPQEYIDMGIPMDPAYGKFEIIDNCTYRFYFDETKTELGEHETAANENGGVIVEIIKIEGKCFYYTSKSTVENQEFVFEGKLCKED